LSTTVVEQAIKPGQWREVALSDSEYELMVEKLGREPTIVELLGREPSPVELGMFGAMWSEHCGYKNSRPLLRNFTTTGDRVLQGPGENAGAVDIGDGLAVVFKIESHNHPSAVEPYEGAATGVGGIVRDIFTMGARPIALLNSLRFGPLDRARNRYLFHGVVGGIGGYGNCLGIPTVAGDVFFDPSYNGNPLVNAMCVGIVEHDQIMRARASGVGNLVVLVGADTGRDGIHGATFASVENPEESHRGVVQVGNPFLEKLLLEACLEVLRTEHVVAMQDLGAAGLTSSIVECAHRGDVGIEIDVAHVSRREQGMNAYEIMLSESQERMLVVVRAEGLADIRRIFDRWDLHSDVIGRVTNDGQVRVLERGDVVVDVAATHFIDDCPTYVRSGEEGEDARLAREFPLDSVADLTPRDAGIWLKRVLASPNVCSREPIVRTYDHTILSNTVLPPLGGDAAVVRIKGTRKALAVKTDCNPRYVYLDPRLGGAHAVAEAARNVTCTGAEPLALTNCLNFGSPERPAGYFQLREAVAGMADAARALGTPVISGNVSLYNETAESAILPTPTVGMVGLLEDVDRHVGSSARSGDALILLGSQKATLGGSEYLSMVTGRNLGAPPPLDLQLERALQALVREFIRTDLISAAHDTSEGGLVVAICEMVMPGGLGASVKLDTLLRANDGRFDRTLFGEAASRIIVAAKSDHVQRIVDAAAEVEVPALVLGIVGGSSLSVQGVLNVPTAELRDAWTGGLRS